MTYPGAHCRSADAISTSKLSADLCRAAFYADDRKGYILILPLTLFRTKAQMFDDKKKWVS